MDPERRRFLRRVLFMSPGSAGSTTPPEPGSAAPPEPRSAAPPEPGSTARPGDPGSSPGEPRWLPIGTVAQFPPGSTTRVNDGRYLLVSRPDGLQAFDAHPASPPPRLRALRLDRDGALFLSPDGFWPDDSILSWMTGTISQAQEDLL